MRAVMKKASDINLEVDPYSDTVESSKQKSKRFEKRKNTYGDSKSSGTRNVSSFIPTSRSAWDVPQYESSYSSYRSLIPEQSLRLDENRRPSSHSWSSVYNYGSRLASPNLFGPRSLVVSADNVPYGFHSGSHSERSTDLKRSNTRITNNFVPIDSYKNAAVDEIVIAPAFIAPELSEFDQLRQIVNESQSILSSSFLRNEKVPTETIMETSLKEETLSNRATILRSKTLLPNRLEFCGQNSSDSMSFSVNRPLNQIEIPLPKLNIRELVSSVISSSQSSVSGFHSTRTVPEPLHSGGAKVDHSLASVLSVENPSISPSGRAVLLSLSVQSDASKSLQADEDAFMRSGNRRRSRRASSLSTNLSNTISQPSSNLNAGQQEETFEEMTSRSVNPYLPASKSSDSTVDSVSTTKNILSNRHNRSISFQLSTPTEPRPQLQMSPLSSNSSGMMSTAPNDSTPAFPKARHLGPVIPINNKESTFEREKLHVKEGRKLRSHFSSNQFNLSETTTEHFSTPLNINETSGSGIASSSNDNGAASVGKPLSAGARARQRFQAAVAKTRILAKLKLAAQKRQAVSAPDVSSTVDGNSGSESRAHTKIERKTSFLASSALRSIFNENTENATDSTPADPSTTPTVNEEKNRLHIKMPKVGIDELLKLEQAIDADPLAFLDELDAMDNETSDEEEDTRKKTELKGRNTPNSNLLSASSQKKQKQSALDRLMATLEAQEKEKSPPPTTPLTGNTLGDQKNAQNQFSVSNMVVAGAPKSVLLDSISDSIPSSNSGGKTPGSVNSSNGRRSSSSVLAAALRTLKNTEDID